MRMDMSMPGKIENTGADTTPASPASQHPRQNTRKNARSTSMPSAATIVRSSTPARTMAPSRVRSSPK